MVNNGEGSVSVLLGNGNGTFQNQMQFSAGETPTDVKAGDFNNDNKLDLVAASFYGDGVSVLLGNGDGTFQVDQFFSCGYTASSVTAGDFNHDNKLDLAVTNPGEISDYNYVAVFLNVCA